MQNWIPKKSNIALRPTLKLTAKAPENGWLEYKPFLLGRLIFRGENVSFRECNLDLKISTPPWLNHRCFHPTEPASARFEAPGETAKPPKWQPFVWRISELWEMLICWRCWQNYWTIQNVSRNCQMVNSAVKKRNWFTPNPTQVVWKAKTTLLNLLAPKSTSWTFCSTKQLCSTYQNGIWGPTKWSQVVGRSLTSLPMCCLPSASTETP